MGVFGKDLLERGIRTFLQAFLAALWGPGVADAIATAPVPSLSAGQSALIAGTAAVLALVSGVITKPLGDERTASMVLDVRGATARGG